jgi:hypothetical protein
MRSWPVTFLVRSSYKIIPAQIKNILELPKFFGIFANKIFNLLTGFFCGPRYFRAMLIRARKKKNVVALRTTVPRHNIGLNLFQRVPDMRHRIYIINSRRKIILHPAPLEKITAAPKKRSEKPPFLIATNFF